MAAAERVQRRLLGRGAAVAADEMQARDRHVELVAAGVFERQELGLAFAEIHALQAEVAADAVLLVHDRVADLDLRQVAQHVLVGRAARFALRALCATCAA